MSKCDTFKLNMALGEDNYHYCVCLSRLTRPLNLTRSYTSQGYIIDVGVSMDITYYVTLATVLLHSETIV